MDAPLHPGDATQAVDAPPPADAPRPPTLACPRRPFRRPPCQAHAVTYAQRGSAVPGPTGKRLFKAAVPVTPLAGSQNRITTPISIRCPPAPCSISMRTPSARQRRPSRSNPGWPMRKVLTSRRPLTAPRPDRRESLGRAPRGTGRHSTIRWRTIHYASWPDRNSGFGLSNTADGPCGLAVGGQTWLAPQPHRDTKTSPHLQGHRYLPSTGTGFSPDENLGGLCRPLA